MSTPNDDHEREVEGAIAHVHEAADHQGWCDDYYCPHETLHELVLEIERLRALLRRASPELGRVIDEVPRTGSVVALRDEIEASVGEPIRGPIEGS